MKVQLISTFTVPGEPTTKGYRLLVDDVLTVRTEDWSNYQSPVITTTAAGVTTYDAPDDKVRDVIDTYESWLAEALLEAKIEELKTKARARAVRMANASVA
jgi:hypothetical protein